MPVRNRGTVVGVTPFIIAQIQMRRKAIVIHPFLITALLILLTGCTDTWLTSGDFRPEASGPEGQVSVVIDSTLWAGVVGARIRDSIGGPIGTLPSQEPMFDIQAVQITTSHALESAMTRKNVLVVAAVNDTLSEESRFVRRSLSAEALASIADGEGVVLPRKDLWRKRQQVFYVMASTPDSLASTLKKGAEGIVARLNEAARQRLQREMFDVGRQQVIEEYLMDNHGYAIHGQHDYVVAIDTSQFVWLRRTLSDTWRSLFVYYEEGANPNDLTAEWVLDTRDTLTRQYIQGTAGGWVEIDRRQRVDSSASGFKDRFGYEVRGLWHMVGRENGRKFPFGMGGPFLTYAFYDEHSHRLYLIDGMVFAPNFPKREFLRQMEVIAYTFRTRQDVANNEEP